MGIVDLLLILFSRRPCNGPGNCSADFNVTGFVDLIDFLDLLFHWGPCP